MTAGEQSMRVTLDTNAIVDIEESRPSAPAIRQLIALHNAGRIMLCVSAIAASERFRDANDRPNFETFTQKLAHVGLGEVELLNPMAYFDVAFFDHAVFAGESDIQLESEIWEILFPGLRRDAAASEGKRRNALCDVQTMWCHISYNGNIFVTRDRNFHKVNKKAALMALGAGGILSPDDAVLVAQG